MIFGGTQAAVAAGTTQGEEDDEEEYEEEEEGRKRSPSQPLMLKPGRKSRLEMVADGENGKPWRASASPKLGRP
jgi:hypothetical protein